MSDSTNAWLEAIAKHWVVPMNSDWERLFPSKTTKTPDNWMPVINGITSDLPSITDYGRSGLVSPDWVFPGSVANLGFDSLVVSPQSSAKPNTAISLIDSSRFIPREFRKNELVDDNVLKFALRGGNVRRQHVIDTSVELEVVAEWDGYVETIHKEYFEARLRGLHGAGVAGETEEAEIPISDFDIEDRELIVEGGLFRLTIVYEKPKVGPKRRYTTVQFRRLPAYSKRELESANRRADELYNAIQMDPSSQASSAG